MNTKLDFSDLEDKDFDSIPTTDGGEYGRNERHSCTPCGGTGVYKGHRVHQERSDCFACRGKGYFLTSKADRLKAKASRLKRKERNLEDNWNLFAEDKPVLAAYLLEVVSWNDFAKSLVEGIKKYGSPTERQLGALVRMHDKHVARNAERSKPKTAVDLGRVSEIFTNARDNHLKRPKLRVGELVLSWGKNDAIYVKGGAGFHDPYYGKVVDGLWHPAYAATPEVTEALVALASDPLSEAVAYGRRTGNCACCGRELTVKESIDRGIGPICFDKWGFS